MVRRRVRAAAGRAERLRVEEAPASAAIGPHAARDGQQVEMTAIELADDVAEQCARLSQALGLTFAGIDLRMAADGRIVCFEVNPSPAYSYYESQTGQPLAAALVRCLSRADAPTGSAARRRPR